MELVIGVVGKPSVGKSTFFNSVTEGKAKMGNFPFTTIEPNTGITFYKTECACKSRGKMAECAPRYGRCEAGTRFIPVRLLDVAGLVPGASEGAGLGNKFLDDLRAADVLIHIIDASGTTNEKGEQTEGYNPIDDATWLDSEVHAWVFNNLWSKWPGVARRHAATRASAAATLIAQLSGYGAKQALVNRVLDNLGVADPVDLAAWDAPRVDALVAEFLRIRFPTLLLLNKADQGGETDANIASLVEKYGSDRCIVGSSAAEFFLKNMTKKKYIKYSPGDSTFLSKADWADEVEFRQMRGEEIKEEEAAEFEALVEPPERKISKRLERTKDMVLYRYGSTGVWAAVQAAVDLKDPVVAYVVKSTRSYVTEQTSSTGGSGVFADCYLVKKGTTVGALAHKVFPDSTAPFQAAEGEDGRRLADDFEIPHQQFVLRYVLRKEEFAEAKREEAQSQRGGSGAKAVSTVITKAERLALADGGGGDAGKS